MAVNPSNLVRGQWYLWIWPNRPWVIKYDTMIPKLYGAPGCCFMRLDRSLCALGIHQLKDVYPLTERFQEFMRLFDIPISYKL